MKTRIPFLKYFFIFLLFLSMSPVYTQIQGKPDVEVDEDSTHIRHVLQVGDSLGRITIFRGSVTAEDDLGHFRYEMKPVNVSSYSLSGQDSTAANQIISDTSLNRIGMFFRKGFIMEDDDGNTVNVIGYDTTFLKTLIELGDGLKLPLSSGSELKILPNEGILFAASDGTIELQIHPDGSVFSGRTDHPGGLRVQMTNGGWIDLHKDEGIVLYDNEGTLVTRFDETGSYHAKLESHPGGLEVLFTDGGKLEMLPDGDMTMWDPGGNLVVQIGPDGSILPDTTTMDETVVNSGITINSPTNETTEIRGHEIIMHNADGIPAISLVAGDASTPVSFDCTGIGTFGSGIGPNITEITPEDGIEIRDEVDDWELQLLPDNGMTMWDPGGIIDVQIGPGGSILPDTTAMEDVTVSSELSVNASSGETTEMTGDSLVMRDADGIPTIYLDGATGNAEYSGLDAQRVARVGVGTDDGFETYITPEDGLEIKDKVVGWELQLLPDDGMTMWDPDGDIDVQIGPGGSILPGTSAMEDVTVSSEIIVNSNNGERTEIIGGRIVVRDEDGNIASSLPHNGPGIFNSGISAFDNGSTESINAESIVADNITASTKNFRIDHPLDPANKWLYHTSIESSEMLNLYTGNTILDDNGEAVVSLPDWFMALNENYRYQLTPIGASAPNLYIAKEVKNNQFSIAGGSSGLKVSWEVSGTRKDDWAKANPPKLVKDKAPRDKR